MADTFLKSKLEAAQTYILELELENHNLKDGVGAMIKQDPEVIAQLEDVISAQKRMLMEGQVKNKTLELEIAAEKQYVSNLKARVSALEDAEKAKNKSSSGTKSTLAQEKKKVAALEDQVYDLKMELRDIKVDKKRLEFEVKQLKELIPGSTLNISYAPSKASASIPKHNLNAPSKPTTKDKRKWEHVNSNVTSNPSPNWKNKSKSNDSDRDDCEPDLDDMPLAQRKMLAIKKEIPEDDMPLAQRKFIVPTSQMAKVKLEPGTEPKAAKKGFFNEDESDDTPLMKRQRSSGSENLASVVNEYNAGNSVGLRNLLGEVEKKYALKRTAFGGSGR